MPSTKHQPALSSDLRRLGPPQMAFVRSWAEGLDIVAAWNRYLAGQGTGDARRIRSELQRILDDLRNLARAHGRPDVAVLLRRDPQAIAEPAADVPTLDQFAAQVPPDYYSQAELVELYESQFGRVRASSAPARRQRLRQRLVQAIQWLEQVGVRQPQVTDPIGSWLDERLTRLLASAGLRTLEDLMQWVSKRGFRWYRGIPRMGPARAARIVAWLRAHEATLGPLPYPALRPLRQIDTAALSPAPRTGIVPFERFQTPAELDGSKGTNRAPADACSIAASTDYEALQAWLAVHKPGSNTWRAYRREAERILLWAVLARGKAVSCLGLEDCTAYLGFLARPEPNWIAPRHTARWSEDWRPFEGPLSTRSQQASVTILRSLWKWLVQRGYLHANPWSSVSLQESGRDKSKEPTLTQDDWAVLNGWLDQQPRSPALHRLTFLVRFTRLSGLRLSELAAGRLGWLKQQTADDGQSAWSIRVPRGGSAWREITLPSPATDALRDYLAARGLVLDPLQICPDAPLVAQLDEEAPLGAARIHDVLEDGRSRCASEVAQRHPEAGRRIRRATADRLRQAMQADGQSRMMGERGPSALASVTKKSGRVASRLHPDLDANPQIGRTERAGRGE